MSASERLAAVKVQLEALKTRIRTTQRAKEEEIDWEHYGKASTVKFNFQTKRSLTGHFGKVYALDWSSEPNMVLSASQDGKLIIWNALTQLKKAAITLTIPWVMTCAYEKEHNRFVACGGLDNNCSIYDVSAASGVGAGVAPPTRLEGHDGYLSSCKFLDGRRMLTSSGDSTCALWDLDSKRKTQTFSDHSADVMRCGRRRRAALEGGEREAGAAADEQEGSRAVVAWVR